jgi:hypothetical protein
MNCDHLWRRMYEQSIIGGYFSIGWKREACGMYVSNSEVTPAGLGGTVGPRHEIMGIHGCAIDTESGKKCRRQIYDESTKELTYE